MCGGARRRCARGGLACVKDILLLDVPPCNGDRDVGLRYDTLIAATLPSRPANLILHTRPRPDHVEIHVMQGERRWRRDNRTSAASIWGIPPHTGVPPVEVTFDIMQWICSLGT